MVDKELADIYAELTGRPSTQLSDGHWISTGKFDDPKRHMSGSWYDVPDVALPDGLMMWIEQLHQSGKEITVQHWKDGTRAVYISDGPTDEFPRVGHGRDMYAAFDRAVRNADKLTPVTSIQISPS